MTDQHNTSAGFGGLIQLWTIQLRRITEGLAGMAELSQSVLPQPVPSLQGLPHPGAPVRSTAALDRQQRHIAAAGHRRDAGSAQGVRRAARDAGGDPGPEG